MILIAKEVSPKVIFVFEDKLYIYKDGKFKRVSDIPFLRRLSYALGLATMDFHMVTTGDVITVDGINSWTFTGNKFIFKGEGTVFRYI